MEIPDHIAIAIYDMAHSMKGPTSPMEMGMNFRRAYWIADQLDEIYADAGIDPEDVQREDIPLIDLGFDDEHDD